MQLLMRIAALFVLNAIICLPSNAQMRKIFSDPSGSMNDVRKTDFSSPSTGWVAFREWLGYTTDSGKTFTRKYITNGNVDYGFNSVDLLFGFDIQGIKSFDANTIVVYGSYGLVPAIIKSTNGGNSFKLVYHSRGATMFEYSKVYDLSFPLNTTEGYAVTNDEIIRTTNGGDSWTRIFSLARGYFTEMAPVNNGNSFIISTNSTANSLYRLDKPNVLKKLTTPAGQIGSVSFLDLNRGWLNVLSGSQPGLYYTSNAGDSWSKISVENRYYPPFIKMRFIDEKTGYGIAGETVFKTTDSGKIWEAIPSDKVEPSTHIALQVLNNNLLWAGGSDGNLEINTNAQGPAIPSAFFAIDTNGVAATGKVKLNNFSKTTHRFEWYVNDTLISTDYNTSYQHHLLRERDVIRLVAINGSLRSEGIISQSFNLPPPPPLPKINSFAPLATGEGRSVTIYGENFQTTSAVSFGGVPCTSFIVISPTMIVATVATGASGEVNVVTAYGSSKIAGFTFIPKPALTAFAPQEGQQESIITITGTGFTAVSAVSFGGRAAAGFTVISDTEIKATLGAGDSGPVSVSGVGGNAAKPGFIFHYPPSLTNIEPRIGMEGDTVRIRGKYFTGAIDVQFGTVAAASFTVVSDTLVIAILGKGSSGVVSMTTQYGWGRTWDQSFTFKRVPTIVSFSPTEGGNGTEVEIIGTEMMDLTKISFGGVPAKAIGRKLSLTKITATVGTGATGDVLIESDYGKASLGTFKWYPRPRFTNFSPASGTAGVIVTINGTNLLNVREIYFGGSAASSFRVISDNVIEATVGNGSTGRVVIKGPGGADTTTSFTLIGSVSPKINSISPLSAPAGSLLTINGANFSSDKALNTVYIGGVQAEVQSSTSNIITAVVPNGTAYAQVTVTTNYLTAISNQLFSASFPGNSGFNAGSFRKVDSVPYANRSWMMKTGDIDGDGKSDLVSVGGSGVSVTRNISTRGNIKFATPVYLSTVLPNFDVVLADFDGDSKLDIAAPALLQQQVLVYRNTSVPGKISFEDTVRFTVNGAQCLAVADFNNDGKPDIVVGKVANLGFSVLINETSGGSIRFAFPKFINVNLYSYRVAATDLNHDGRVDFLAGGNEAHITPKREPLAVVYNTNSTTVRFDSSYFKANPFSVMDFQYADLDGDAEFDLIVNGSQTAIHKNNGSGKFGEPVIIPSTTDYGSVTHPADLDGDGKPDLAKIEERSDSLAVFQNRSRPGDMQFGPPAKYHIGKDHHMLAITDFDGDGRPDIAAAHSKGIDIISNKTENIALQLCANSDTSVTAGMNGSRYQWQFDMGSGFIDVTDNSYFTGSKTEKLLLNDIPSTWNGYKLRCMVDDSSSAIITLVVREGDKMSVAITTDRTEICAGTALKFTADIKNADSYFVDWQINGNTFQTIGTSISPTMLKNGDEVSLKVTASSKCFASEIIRSNTIKITVNPVNAIEAKIIASATEICEGQTVRFRSEIKNADSSTRYSWKVNGVAISDTTDSLVTNSLKNGDKVQLFVTGTGKCLPSATVNSNVVEIRKIGPASIIISGNSNLKAGETAVITSRSTNAGATFSYQWQDSTANHGWTDITGARGAAITYMPFASGEKLRSKLIRTGTCPETAFSNVITFELQEHDPAPNQVHSYPNPVQNILYIDSLSSVDEWTSLEVYSLNGRTRIMQKNIVGQTRTSIDVGHLPKGLYMVVFRRNYGSPKVIKFIKL